MTNPEEAERMFEQLLKEAAKPESAGVDLPSQLIMPQPGFCMKTVRIPEGTNPWVHSGGWPEGAEKVFLNICYSEKLPDPPDISEEKLVEILQVTGKPERFSKDPLNVHVWRLGQRLLMTIFTLHSSTLILYHSQHPLLHFSISEDAEGAEGFRVPMSLGEPHAELDKSGKGW